MTASRAAVVEAVRSIIDRQLRLSEHGHQLGAEDNLWSLGMTSLSSLGLMLAIEDTLGVEFPDDLLNEATFRSVDTIAAAVESVQPG